GEPPDPQDEGTFLASRLDRSLRMTQRGRAIESLYAGLIQARREIAALGELDRSRQDVAFDEARRTMVVRRWSERDEALLLYNFSADEADLCAQVPAPGVWSLILDTAD